MKHQRSICKIFKRMLIFVIVGLIMSVGVAWSTVVWVGELDFIGRGPAFYTAQHEPLWLYYQTQGTAYVTIWSSADHDENVPVKDQIKEGPSWSRISKPPNADAMQSGMSSLEQAWGWPLVCIASVSELPREWQPSDWSIATGIQFGTRTRFVPPTLIPIRPLWTRLLVNTFLYAFTTWSVLVGRVLLRNAIRRKRGQCIHCRYIIRELQVCPECGSEVRVDPTT